MKCTVFTDPSACGVGLVAEWGGRKYPVCCIPQARPGQRPPAHRLADLILRTMEAAGQAVSFNSYVYFYTKDGWVTPLGELDAQHVLDTATFVTVPTLPQFAPTFDLPSPACSKQGEGAPDVHFWAAAVGKLCPDALPLFELPRDVARYMVNQAYRRNPARVEGVLQHPLVGKPRGRWVGPEAVRADADDYSHLLRLFAPLKLKPAAHCLAVSYLLGLFHAASLDYARPILFVDSWVRGRGKSELGRVLVRLLDNRDDSIVLASKGLSETVTSHLIRGGRVLLGQNMNDVVDWNSEYLASLATDGSVGDRPKYGRTTASFRGVATVLNGVYGSFTLAEDMVARIWRVELDGPCPQSELGLPDYAQDNRRRIHAEIIRAHTQAKPWKLPTLSRCNEFERVALSAYADVMGWSHEEVAALYEQALKQAGGLATPCVQHLHHRHPGRFERPSEIATGGTRICQQSREPGKQYDGVCALGMCYNAITGEWTEVTP